MMNEGKVNVAVHMEEAVQDAPEDAPGQLLAAPPVIPQHPAVNPALNRAKKFLEVVPPLVILGNIVAVEEFGKTSIIAANGSKNIAVESLMSMTLGVLLSSDIGYLGPIQPMIATAYGRSNNLQLPQLTRQGSSIRIGHIMRQGWILASILSLPTSILLYNSEPILNAFGQNTELTSIVGPYAKIVAFACPAIYLSAVDSSLLRATSKMKSLFAFNIMGAVITLGMSAMLIPGHFGIPAQGINGVGYAILTKEWAIWFAVKAYFLSTEFRPFRIFNLRSTNLHIVKKILCERICKLGTCFTFLNWSEQAKGFVIGLMMGRLGINQLIINQAASAYLQFFVPASLGLRQGTQIVVGFHRGSHDYALMKRSGNLGILYEFSLNALPLIPYVLFPMELTTYFVPKSEVEDLETLIRLTFLVTALGRMVNAIQGPAAENLKGVLDIYFPTIVQFLTSVVLTLPLCYLMGFELDWNLMGLGAAASIGTAASIPPLLYRWIHIERYIVQTEAIQPDFEEDFLPLDPDLPENDPEDAPGLEPGAFAIDPNQEQNRVLIDANPEQSLHAQNGEHEVDIPLGSPVSESSSIMIESASKQEGDGEGDQEQEKRGEEQSEKIQNLKYTPLYQSMGERNTLPTHVKSQITPGTRPQ